MKNFFLAFMVFLLYAFLGMAYYSCVIKGLCPDLDLWTTSEIDDTEKLEVENDLRKKELVQRQKDT